jgi:hypothetical protein
MKRLVLAIGLAASLIAAVSVASAAPLPSGSITCQVDADTGPWGLRVLPSISSVPSAGRVTLKDVVTGSCDAAGVSGGKAPITNVEANLSAKLVPGSTCLDLVTAPHFERVKLKLKWTNVDITGRKRVVATSTAHNFVASYDDTTQGIVWTATILKGAFAGSGVTTRLTFDVPEAFDDACGSYGGIYYGSDGDSLISVP